MWIVKEMFKLILVLVLFFRVSSLMASSTLQIEGWPWLSEWERLLRKNQGDFEDPLLRRLVCPALTRLNLKTQQNEPLLLKEIKAQPLVWSLTLRTQIYWWDKSEVTAEHLKVFLEKALPFLGRNQFVGRWPVPSFTVQVKSRYELDVKWSHPPFFGPYILGFAGLFREPKKASETAGECAGMYHPTKISAKEIELTLNPLYRSRFKKLHLVSETKSQGGSFLRFKGARLATRSEDFLATTQGKGKTSVCSHKWPLPYYTGIFWNQTKEPTKDLRVRQALTQLLPRGELLRTGANGYGELVSGPFLRLHPGYDAASLVRPFQPSSALKELEALGYKREAIGDPLSKGVKDDAQPLKLQLGTRETQVEKSIILKLITDAFAGGGIASTIVPHTAAKDMDPKGVDGILAGFFTDWPEAELMKTFHSFAPESGFFHAPKDKLLDDALEAYALSLTTLRPDFGLLKRVHKRIFELEPISILMAHHVCVEGSTDISLQGMSPIDPDWIRKFVF